MEPHVALPQLVVVGDEEMQQFVDDDVVPKVLIQIQQFDIEVQMAIDRTGGPFITHRAHTKPHHFNPRPDHGRDHLRDQLLLLD